MNLHFSGTRKPSCVQIAAADQEPDAEIALPQPTEQIKLPKKESEPVEQQSVDSVEQVGSLKTKGVSAKLTSKIKINNYPRRSRLLGEEGTVTLELHISAEGSLLHRRVIESSGYTRLDKDAEKRVSKATFAPAIKNGKPVEDIITIPVKYTLTD